MYVKLSIPYFFSGPILAGIALISCTVSGTICIKQLQSILDSYETNPIKTSVSGALNYDSATGSGRMNNMINDHSVGFLMCVFIFCESFSRITYCFVICGYHVALVMNENVYIFLRQEMMLNSP